MHYRASPVSRFGDDGVMIAGQGGPAGIFGCVYFEPKGALEGLRRLVAQGCVVRILEVTDLPWRNRVWEEFRKAALEEMPRVDEALGLEDS